MIDFAVADFSGGMNDSASATAFPQNAVSVMQNLRILPDGTAQVRYGSQRLHPTALNSGGQGYGGVQFITSDGTRQLVVFCGDQMLFSEDQGATWTNPSGADDLRQDYWSFATMAVAGTTYLLCANGDTNSYKWDGTTWDTIDNIPSGVKFLATFNERLWAWGHSDVELAASEIADFESWNAPNGLVLPIQTHDGDDIATGLAVSGAMLLVFKRKSVSVVEGFGNSDIVVAAGARGLSRTHGCVAFRTIVEADGALVWLSEQGWVALRGLQVVPVLEGLRTFARDLPWSEIDSARGTPCALFYPALREVWQAVPADGGTNNVIACMAAGGGGALFTFPAEDGGTLYMDADFYLHFDETASAQRANINADGYLEIAGPNGGAFYMALDDDGYIGTFTATAEPAVLFVGDMSDEPSAPLSVGYDGYVRRMNTGALDDVLSDGTGGVPIPAVLRSGPALFGAPSRVRRAQRKWVRRIETLATNSSAADLTLTAVVDGVGGGGMAVTVPATVNTQPARARANVTGRGFTLQAEVSTAVAGIRIAEIGLSAQLVNDR